jgi:mannose-1-phosphate guanylyltransferase/mannose-6-phosphate isomerase
VEKPDFETAAEYLRSGQYLWNSGMFLFGAAALLDEFRVHAPQILEPCMRALAGAAIEGSFVHLPETFLECPSTSIDYAIMEKTSRGAVVPLAAGWNDVGSWSALHEVLEHDAHGNVAVGDALLEGCTNTFVLADGRTVAVVGLDNVVVVETEDAVLVVRRDKAQDVKRIVDRLKAEGRDALLADIKSSRRS